MPYDAHQIRDLTKAVRRRRRSADTTTSTAMAAATVYELTNELVAGQGESPGRSRL
jgi:hypothetical protein